MCFHNPSAPGCSCTTRPCNSFFGMTNGWWPYLDWFWGTYGGYTAGGCHPPWYFLMFSTDWYPAAYVAPLPIHCLGTDTFINGSLHASFSAVWPSLVLGSRTLSRSMYLARATSSESRFLKCLQLSSSSPQKTCARQSAPTLSSFSLIFSNPAYTVSTLCFCGAFIPNNVFRNTEQVDINQFAVSYDVGGRPCFSQTYSEFLGWYYWCVFFLAKSPSYPKFPVRSNGWKP